MTLNAETHINNREAAVRLLKAMANEHRLDILCALRDGEASVSELCERLALHQTTGNSLSQSALSQHLALLRNEHLVICRRDAQSMCYSLNGEHAIHVISLLYRLYAS